MNEVENLIVLNLVRGLGPVRVKKLLERFGSAGEVLASSASRLQEAPGIGPVVARAVAGWRELPYREEFVLIQKLRLKVLTIFDEGYPENLKEIYDPPVVLYIMGDLRAEDKLSLAVVGSRRASHYGRQTAFRISGQLAGRGFTVVSGLARGIDGQAHRGALVGKGRTIAVLGSGLGNVYPSEHGELAREIASSGAVISEFPVRTAPERTNFPLRNRVISGLSMGVLVVEAARKSGALITARTALDQGRLVMAVPGRVDSFSAEGTNQLIQEGAKMVRSLDDIVEEFEYLASDNAAGRPAEEGAVPPHLTPEEELVYGLLSEEERGIDLIIRESGMASGAVTSILLSLELKRLVKRLPGKTYIRA